MTQIIKVRWQARRDTSENLASVNEVPLDGEIILETDTGMGKQGDGATHYNDLPYTIIGKVDFTGSAAGKLLKRNSTDDGWVLSSDETGVETVTGSAVNNADPKNPVINSTGGAGGILLGYAYTESSTPVSTTSHTIPADNTIPQSSEGAAYSELDTTITPVSATSKLEVEIHLPLVSLSNTDTLRFAVFRDSGSDAVFATTSPSIQNGFSSSVNFKFVVNTGSTSPTTFRIRWATFSVTGYINSFGGTSYFGGAVKSSMTIRELSA